MKGNGYALAFFHVLEEEQAKRELGKASLTPIETRQWTVFADHLTKGSLVECLLRGSSQPLAGFPGEQSLLRQNVVSASKRIEPHSSQNHPTHPGIEMSGPAHPSGF